MKKTLLIVFILPALIIFSQKNDINGTWCNGADTLEFLGGYCIINGERTACRCTDSELLFICKNGEMSRYPYLLSFDKNTLFFNLDLYERVCQSGKERSIIGFFLEKSPLCLS